LTSGYCNNNCIFCCDRDPGLRFFSSHNLPCLTLDEFKKEIEKLKEKHPILFTGGEPTLNKDLILLIKFARRSGYQNICLQTNGRLLRYKDFCIKLIENGLTEITISIHGWNRKQHDGLVRSPGGYNQTYQALSNLVYLKDKYNIKINTASTISKLNYKHIYQLLETLLSFKKIDNIVLNTIMYAGNAKRFFKQIFVSYSEVAKEFKNAIIKYGNSINKHYSSINLSPMPFCLMGGFERYVGIQEMPLEINNGKVAYKPRAATQTKNSNCKLCKYFDICSGIDSTYADKIGWSEFSPITK